MRFLRIQIFINIVDAYDEGENDSLLEMQTISVLDLVCSADNFKGSCKILTIPGNSVYSSSHYVKSDESH